MIRIQRRLQYLGEGQWTLLVDGREAGTGGDMNQGI